MYVCKNCGLKYQTDEAVICVRCQAPRGAGNQFCPFCGNQIQPGGHICMNCGVDTIQYGMLTSGKSKVVAGLLGIFLGYVGVHNFYLGKKTRGIVQALVFAFSFILMFAGAIVMDIIGESDIVIGLGVIAFLIAYIGLIVAEIWGFVEGIMILCGKINKDGKGNLLKN